MCIFSKAAGNGGCGLDPCQRSSSFTLGATEGRTEGQGSRAIVAGRSQAPGAQSSPRSGGCQVALRPWKWVPPADREGPEGVNGCAPPGHLHFGEPTRVRRGGRGRGLWSPAQRWAGDHQLDRAGAHRLGTWRQVPQPAALHAPLSRWSARPSPPGPLCGEMSRSGCSCSACWAATSGRW